MFENVLQFLHTHCCAVATKSNDLRLLLSRFLLHHRDYATSSHKHKQLISEKSLKMHKVYKYIAAFIYLLDLFFGELSGFISRTWLYEARSWHFRFAVYTSPLYFYRRRLKRFLTSRTLICISEIPWVCHLCMPTLLLWWCRVMTLL